MNATLNYAPLTRFAVGFEDLFREMDKLQLNSTNTTYPPNNIVSVDENKFQIEYLIDLFTNFNFIFSIRINKNDYSIQKLNKYKNIVI